MRETLRKVLVNPMDVDEAGRRVQYTSPGSLMHRALLGLIAQRTAKQPELEAARKIAEIWMQTAAQNERAARKWRRLCLALSLAVLVETAVFVWRTLNGG
jgi:hypothetical protein